MVPYQVLLIDGQNYTFAIEEVEGEDDKDAIVKAQNIRLPTFGGGFELWQGMRFVCGSGVTGEPAADFEVENGAAFSGAA